MYFSEKDIIDMADSAGVEVSTIKRLISKLRELGELEMLPNLIEYIKTSPVKGYDRSSTLSWMDNRTPIDSPRLLTEKHFYKNSVEIPAHILELMANMNKSDNM